MIRSERGANLVEMALVSTFLLLLVAGVVDIGRAFNNYIIITNSAREGARQGSRLPCNGANQALFRLAIVDAAIQEAAGSGVDLVGGNIAIDPDPVGDGCPAAGSPIDVTVEFNFATILGGILGVNEFPLRITASMLFYGNDQE
jgi:Flp pilus assembly protein TadG